MKFTKKDYKYLVKEYDNLMTLQAKILDWEEEDMIGDCTPTLKRIEIVRNDLLKKINMIENKLNE